MSDIKDQEMVSLVEEKSNKSCPKDEVTTTKEKDIINNESSEDLEDGEIDDDDGDDNNDVTITAVVPAVNAIIPRQQTHIKNTLKQTNTLSVIDLSDDRAISPPIAVEQTKSKRPTPLDDDHASSIEHALANALKKRGIEPPMPKISSTSDNKEVEPQAPSRSSRRRKRKKQREEKERKEKKKRFDSPEATSPADNDDMDDYEMLNVRGGSPPPATHAPASFANYKDNYDSADDSDSSEDTSDSNDGTLVGNGERRRRRATQKRDSRKRRDRNTASSRGDNAFRRRDSIDDKHQRNQEPRKLELCKFYLMECCAKKEKCSYMHSDFPCKYYYLGMECTSGSECKFAHGQPLNEQLRNILLKHLETAPKEILGNFKRISREQALALLFKHHGELCEKFGTENSWTNINGNNNNLPVNRRGGEHMQQQQLPPTNVNPVSKIPSLLDMVINPPPEVTGTKITDKHRKTRWTDSKEIIAEHSVKVLPPSYLDLSNLTGVLSPEHIDKLTEMGITNLEQVNQLTFGQLNQIGLTIAEISEIQAKLQGNDTNNSTKTDSLDIDNEIPAKTPKSHTTKAILNKPDISIAEDSNKDKDGATIPNVKTTEIETSSIGSFDYSQYLRDSNLAFDRLESCEDEKDDEQLVIDENIEQDDVRKSLSAIGLGNDEKMNDYSAKDATFHREELATKLYNIRSNDLHSIKRNSSRSPSHTPTRSQSSTPEANESPDTDDMLDDEMPNYERSTMYDFNVEIATQEEEENKIDDSNSHLPSELQLPFTPMMNYTPATEIDGSITSHLPMTYKVYEVDIKRPSYMDQRKSCYKTVEPIIDPRLRRILGLPEIKGSISSPASRTTHKYSNNIASPDSEGASPKYYIPPSSSPYYEDRKKNKSTATVVKPSYTITTATTTIETTTTIATSKPTDPRSRQDPRRAAAAAKSRVNDTNTEANNVPQAEMHGTSAAMTQNTEIRNLLQKSEWYKNLNSKFKIMVNQQLALVSTELKKFHQNPSPQKIFDITFILNNSTLQQILTHLGIYIDDNGEVAHIEGDGDEQQKLLKQQNGNERQIQLPNLSQPPPDFLRGPPPNMTGPPPNLTGALQSLPPPQIFRPNINITPFGVLQTGARPSLLGLPPTGNTGNTFNNPFGADLTGGVSLAPAAFASSILGPGNVTFGNFNSGQQAAAAAAAAAAGLMLSANIRNFGNNSSNTQRGNRNRRNKI